MAKEESEVIDVIAENNQIIGSKSSCFAAQILPFGDWIL